MFVVGQLVRHKDGRRGVVITHGMDGGWYTVSWLNGHGIDRVIPFNMLEALAPHGHDRKHMGEAMGRGRVV